MPIAGTLLAKNNPSAPRPALGRFRGNVLQRLLAARDEPGLAANPLGATALDKSSDGPALHEVKTSYSASPRQIHASKPWRLPTKKP